MVSAILTGVFDLAPHEAVQSRHNAGNTQADQHET